MQRSNGSPAGDSLHTVRGGGRLEWQPNDRDSVTLHGDAYSGAEGQTSDPSLGYPGAPTRPDHVQFSGGYALGRWERKLSNGDFAMQAYYNREGRSEAGTAGVMNTTNLDFQHHFSAGTRNDVIWGVGYRRNQDQVTSPTSMLDLRESHDNLWSVFLQDDLTLIPDRMVLTAGSKFEHNGYTGAEVEPGIRLTWTPTAAQSVWASASRAVRQPALIDMNLLTSIALPALPGSLPLTELITGKHNLTSEVLDAYEAGYRRRISRRASLDVAGFYNKYSRLQNWEMLAPQLTMAGGVPGLVLPVSKTNGMYGTSSGLETTATWSPKTGWRLAASHSWISGRFSYYPSAAIPAGNDTLRAPRNTVNLRSGWDLGRHWTLDASLYCATRLTTPIASSSPARTAPGIPGYQNLDIRVGYKLRELGEISAGVTDLLKARHLEFIPVNDPLLGSYIERSVYVRFVRSF